MFIHKKIIFLFLLTGIGGIVSPCKASVSFPRGIYAGIGAGYNHLKSTMGDITAKQFGGPAGANGDPFTIPGQRQDLSSLGITGFLGYLHVFPKYSITLGGEAYWFSYKGEKTFHGGQLDQNGDAFFFDMTTRFSQQYEYGLKFMLGYLIDSMNHLYGLVGMSTKGFKESNRLTISGGDEDGNQAFSNLVTSTFNKTYFLVGLGYERACCPSWKYGVEGFYQFGRQTKPIDNNFPFFFVVPVSASTQSPRQLGDSFTILFKISYSFNVLGE